MNNLTNSFKLYAEQLSKNRQLLSELFQANSSFSFQLSSEQKRTFFKNNIGPIVLQYYQYLKSNKFMSKISEQMLAYFKKRDLTQILCDFNDWLTVYQNIDVKIQNQKNPQSDNNIYQIINSQFLIKQLNSKSTLKDSNQTKQLRQQQFKNDKMNNNNVSKDSQQDNIKNKSIQVSKQENKKKLKDTSKTAHAGNVNTSKDKNKKGEATKNIKQTINQDPISSFSMTTLYKQKYQQVNGKNESIFDWKNDKQLIEGMPQEVIQCLKKDDHKRQNRILLAYMLVQPHNASKYSFILRRINHCHLQKQQA